MADADVERRARGARSRPACLARPAARADRRPRPAPRLGAGQGADHRARRQRHDDPPRPRRADPAGAADQGARRGDARRRDAGDHARAGVPRQVVGADRREARRSPPPPPASCGRERRSGSPPARRRGTWRRISSTSPTSSSSRTRSASSRRLLAHDRPHRNVMLIGGIRTPSDALVGPLAVQALEPLHLDQVFLGRPRDDASGRGTRRRTCSRPTPTGPSSRRRSA